jgi:hypothetical protein
LKAGKRHQPTTAPRLGGLWRFAPGPISKRKKKSGSNSVAKTEILQKSQSKQRSTKFGYSKQLAHTTMAIAPAHDELTVTIKHDDCD